MPAPVTAVILAAGAGRRLGALGDAGSKAMVRVLGRPLIEWVLERLGDAGIEEVIVVAHADDQPLQELIKRPPARAAVVVQRQRLGIADAVVQALSALGEPASYLACACDSLFESQDIRAVVAAGGADTGIAVVGVQNMGVPATASRSAVEIDGGWVARIVEKPPPGTTASPLVALPLYWLTPAVAPHLRAAAAIGGERHVSTALNDFIAAGGRVRAVPVARRIEITSPADVGRAEELLRGE
jgi:NDP-sugar pyrophosphorylase family protein